MNTVRRPIVFLFLSFAFGIALQRHTMQEIYFLLLYAVLLLPAYTIARILKWQQERIALICLFFLVILLGSLTFYLAENRADPESPVKECP